MKLNNAFTFLPISILKIVIFFGMYLFIDAGNPPWLVESEIKCCIPHIRK